MMYARLFPVHTLGEDDGVARPSDGSVSMPAPVKTMQESLKTDGQSPQRHLFHLLSPFAFYTPSFLFA
jgi:hypothetical protein